MILTRCSSLAIIFFPPFKAAASASSSRNWMSFSWASRAFLVRSITMVWSCSWRNSSANLAASIIAFLLCSSELLSELRFSSKSDCKVELFHLTELLRFQWGLQWATAVLSPIDAWPYWAIDFAGWHRSVVLSPRASPALLAFWLFQPEIQYH